MTLKTLLAVSALAILPACATPQSIMPNAENSVRKNIAAQAITPPPSQKANTNIPADETLRAAARKRYREGTVTEPKVQDTR